MEQNKDKLQEEALEEVAGGRGVSTMDNCFFEPSNPVKYEIKDGVLRAECKSICKASIPFITHNNCSCFGTPNCIDRWHKIENRDGDGNVHVAFPKGAHNHNEQRKWVYGVKL